MAPMLICSRAVRNASPPPALADRDIKAAASLSASMLAALAATSVSRDDLLWHQAVVSLRALTEVASWAEDGTIQRVGHPWLIRSRELAARLAAATGVAVRSS